MIDDEHALALEDFASALDKGAAEAADVLRSYAAELQAAPQQLQIKLASVLRSRWPELTGAAAASPSDALSLESLVLQLVRGSPAAVLEVQAAWSDAAAALLYGQPGDRPSAAVDRLVNLCGGGGGGSTHLAERLLDDTRLRLLPSPATHQQAASLAACLLSLHLFPSALPGAPAGLAQRLTAMAAPTTSFGFDLTRTRQQQAAAFGAFVEVMQSSRVRRHLRQLELSQPAAAAEAHAAALRFLLLFRPPLPAATDLWWAHFAAVLHALIDQAVQPVAAAAAAAAAGKGSKARGRAASEQTGLAALGEPSLRHLVRSLCCQETAHMVVQLTLAHPDFQPAAAAGTSNAPAAAAPRTKRGGKGKAAQGADGGGGKGAGGAKAAGRVREALAVAAELLAHDVPAFLSGCCELLRPEANAALQTRVEALAAMGHAATAFPAEPERASADGSSGNVLWLPAVLDQVLFVARSDPSVRIRREAVKLLGAAAGLEERQEARVVQAAAQRCRDRDEGVRREAFDLLASFSQASLERSLQPSDWLAVLDMGLAGPLLPQPSTGGAGAAGGSKGGGKGGGSGRHAAAVQERARQLLLQYLGCQQQQEGSGSEEEECEAEDEEMEEGGEAEAAPGAEKSQQWQDRLQGLLPPSGQIMYPPAAAKMQAHLQAAWRQALEEVLQPEQLAAVGGELGLAVGQDDEGEGGGADEMADGGEWGYA